MALEATHIKFALDLKNNYGIQNESAYISGSIYPDSRYITKIDRHLTHNLDNLNPKTDFEKGWQNHLLCDKIQGLMMNKHLPDEFDSTKNEMVQGNAFWVRRTAIKIIQDIEILNSFNLKPLLKNLDYTETPFSENTLEMEKYNILIQNLYSKLPTLEDYKKMWVDFGTGEELAEEVIKETKKILDNKNLLNKIKQLYNIMIEEFNKNYTN